MSFHNPMIRLMRTLLGVVSAGAAFPSLAAGAVLLSVSGGDPEPLRTAAGMVPIPSAVSHPAPAYGADVMVSGITGGDFLQRQFEAYVNATSEGLPDVAVPHPDPVFPVASLPAMIAVIDPGLGRTGPAEPVAPESAEPVRMDVDPIAEATTGILGLAGLALSCLVPVAVLLFARDWAFRNGEERTAEGF